MVGENTTEAEPLQSTPVKSSNVSTSKEIRTSSSAESNEESNCTEDRTVDLTNGEDDTAVEILSTTGHVDDDPDLNEVMNEDMIEMALNEDLFNEDSEMAEVNKDSDVIIPVISEIDDIIELSDDEEPEQDADVSLVCLKRPNPIEQVIECYDILEDDEEYPVCLGEAEKTEGVSAIEKQGYVKEYIENEGLAIIHSEEFGLVLFHLDNVWIDGKTHTSAESRRRLPIGSHVNFYDKEFEGPEYKVLNSEGVILQAVLVWTGIRPKHLMKIVDSQDRAFWQKLEEGRKTFVLYLRGEVFTRVPYVRIKGTVKGYLNDQFGIIEMIDENDAKQNVFFHEFTVKIFRKDVKTYNQPLYKILPAGLKVSVDACRVHIPGVKNLPYQAISVFAGTWPIVPHPTLLPGGPGSVSSAFQVPEERSTFYYMELALESHLGKTRNVLKKYLSNFNGVLEFQWEGVNVVKNQADAEEWRCMVGHPRRYKTAKRFAEKRKLTHTFKAPLRTVFKTKDEMDTRSEVANQGSLAGSISGSDYASRTHSRMSTYSDGSSKSTKMVRTWYNPDASSYGGLRLKQEVKAECEEYQEYGEPSKKRVKLEV